MSKFGLVVLFFLLAGECNAQSYFVFIDAGNRQPFYVRLDSQFYSSSAEGHIILSRLRDSLYDITIGFPGQTAPEQHYELGIRGKDQAFEIRDRVGDAPGLFDLQSNEWMKTHTKGNGADEFRSTGMKKDDAFSRMMAGIVHDTAVLYNTYAIEQAPNDSPALAKSPTTSVALPAPTTTASIIPAAIPDTGVARHDTAAFVATTPSATITTTPASAPPIPAAAPETKVFRPDTSVTKPDTSVAFNASSPKTIDSTALAVKAVEGTSIPVKSVDNLSLSAAAATRPASDPTDTPRQLYRPVTPQTAPDTTGRTAAPLTMPTVTTPTIPDTATQLYRPIAHPPVPDTPGLLYRPIAGTSGHKAPPVVDSPGKTPLFRPITHVTKLSERRSSHSVRLVYADQSQGKKADTIVVIIPVDTVGATTTRAHGPNANADSPRVNQNAVFRPLVPAGNPAADNTRPGSQVDTLRQPVKPAAVYVNSDCHNFANDLDVDKLRAKMLEAIKDDDRIAVARKAFKVKCFYTRYIRALSEIFTTDAAKYRFFEAAWPFAADEHFHELSNLLADPVYSGKFKILTSHP
jgi:hypothetical protein